MRECRIIVMTVRSRTMTVRSRTAGLHATCEVAPLSLVVVGGWGGGGCCCSFFFCLVGWLVLFSLSLSFLFFFFGGGGGGFGPSKIHKGHHDQEGLFSSPLVTIRA